jgi:hypothetical protein
MQTTLLALMMTSAMAAQTELFAESATSAVDLTVPGNKGSATTVIVGDGDFCAPKAGGKAYWCWTQPTESLTLTYNAPTAGTYYVSVNYGTVKNGAAVVLSVNGADLPATPLPATGGWEAFQYTAAVQVTLTAGANSIKVTDVSAYPAGAMAADGVTPLTGKMNAAMNVASVIVSDAAIVAPVATTAAPAPGVTTVAAGPTTTAAPLGVGVTFQMETPASSVDTTPGNSATTNAFTGASGDLDACVTAAGVVPAANYVCWTAIGESLTYNVNVDKEADYSFVLNYATKKDGANVKVTVDGVEAFGKVATPSTLGWETFSIANGSKTAHLTAGPHTVVVEILASSVDAKTNIPINMDAFSLYTGGAAPTAAPTAATTAAAGSATTTKAPVAEQAKLPSSGNMVAISSVFAALSAAAVYFGRQQ